MDLAVLGQRHVDLPVLDVDGDSLDLRWIGRILLLNERLGLAGTAGQREAGQREAQCKRNDFLHGDSSLNFAGPMAMGVDLIAGGMASVVAAFGHRVFLFRTAPGRDRAALRLSRQRLS